MRKSEKNAFFSKSWNGRILISWNLIVDTFFCTKIKKFTIGNFFSLDTYSRPMWVVSQRRGGSIVAFTKSWENDMMEFNFWIFDLTCYNLLLYADQFFSGAGGRWQCGSCTGASQPSTPSPLLPPSPYHHYHLGHHHIPASSFTQDCHHVYEVIITRQVQRSDLASSWLLVSRLLFL